jgi:hypothetical protein
MFLNSILVFLIATFDLTSLLFSVVPMSAGVGFLLWVGILITAQAFEQVVGRGLREWDVEVMGRRGAAAVTSDSDYDDHSNTQNATIIVVHVLIHPHHTTTPHPPTHPSSTSSRSIQLQSNLNQPTNRSLSKRILQVQTIHGQWRWAWCRALQDGRYRWW